MSLRLVNELKHFSENLQELVEERTEELRLAKERHQVLLEINNAIITNLDRTSLHQAIADALRDVLPYDRAALTLLDAERDVFKVHALVSTSSAKRFLTVGMEFPRKGSPVEHILDGKRPLIRHHLDKVRLSGVEPKLVKEGIRSYVTVPLMAKGEPLGILNLGSRAPEEYSQADAELLMAVGRQVALAVENMLAYEEIAQLKARLEQENLYLLEEIRTHHKFEEIIGRSPAMKKVLKGVEQVAPTDATVLILGETGTGKELVARAVHSLSPVKSRTLVKVNCAALPASLIESELFGHEKGAFTGATARKIGRFELADGGSIFLDEIGELPLDLQVKLLRVLQEGTFERVGSSRTTEVRVRVIAATNRDLVKGMKEGTFREDLYYRLNVFPLRIPPLRERKSDIPLLVRHFVRKHGARFGKQIQAIPQGRMDDLEAYSWPGNVRELENVVERAMILSRGPELDLGDWTSAPGMKLQRSGGSTLADVERDHILKTLELTHWQLSGEQGAAKILGLKRTTLQGKMRKLGTAKSSGCVVQRADAQNDFATTQQGQSVGIDVLANDTDSPGQDLGSVGQPRNGTTSVTGLDRVIYDPDDDFFGTDSFVYVNTSGCLQCSGDFCTEPDFDSATVTVTVTQSSPPRRLTVSRNGTGDGTVTSSPAGINCGSDCSEVYDQGTRVTLTATPDEWSTFTRWSGCDSVSGNQCTVTLDADRAVTATFTLRRQRLTVGRNGTGDGTVSSSPAGISCGTDCSEVYDHGTPVTLTATANASSAFIGWSGCDSVSGNRCTVTLNADRTVTATFDVTNVPPTARNDAFSTDEDVVLNVAAPGVLGNDTDADGDALRAVLVRATTNGTLSLRPDGSFTYTPAANFNGTDSFTYRANDGTANSAVVTAVLTVRPVNDPPIAVDDSAVTEEGSPVVVAVLANDVDDLATLDEDTTLDVAVLANDSDPDGDPIAVESVTQPANGTAVLLTDQTIRYSPNANFNGSDRFSYTVRDVHGTTATAEVLLTVRPVNDPPRALCRDLAVAADSSCQGGATGIEVDNGSFDVDGDGLSFTLAPDGPFSLGLNDVTLLVDDGQGGTDNCSARVEVLDVSQPLITCGADVVRVITVSEVPVDFALPTAADNCSAAPTVTCDAAPGDVFPLGVSTVSCSAVDASANSSSCAFTVTLLTPDEQGQNIIDLIRDLVDAGILNGGQGNALTRRIENALARSNPRPACGQLGAFTNQVNDFIANGILSSEDGQELLDAVRLIEDGLGC